MIEYKYKVNENKVIKFSKVDIIEFIKYLSHLRGGVPIYKSLNSKKEPYNNNNVESKPINHILLFIEELGKDQIIGFTLSSVMNKYEKWCKNKKLTPQKMYIINSTIKKALNLKIKTVRFKKSKDYDYLINESDQNPPVRIWAE